MTYQRPYTDAVVRLKELGLRPTKQRLALARLLFEGPDRHVTAEELHAEAHAAKIRVSLATVYNTLNQFSAVGLLREVVVQPTRSYFDTNSSDHHHFFIEDSGKLHDIPSESVSLQGVPQPPDGTEVSRVDVVVRVRKKPKLH